MSGVDLRTVMSLKCFEVNTTVKQPLKTGKTLLHLKYVLKGFQVILENGQLFGPSSIQNCATTFALQAKLPSCRKSRDLRAMVTKMSR